MSNWQKHSNYLRSFCCQRKHIGIIRSHHYNDVIMGTIASQTTSLASVYSPVWLGADQRKHQSSASLAFVRGIHRTSVNSPHKATVTRKMFPFYDVIMYQSASVHIIYTKPQPLMISFHLKIGYYVLENHTGLNLVPYRHCPVHNTLRPRQNVRHFPDDYSNAFSWMMMYEFRLKFHRSLFLRFKLIIYSGIGSDNGLAPVQATSHYLN